jgi:hypothetical protein
MSRSGCPSKLGRISPDPSPEPSQDRATAIDHLSASSDDVGGSNPGDRDLDDRNRAGRDLGDQDLSDRNPAGRDLGDRDLGGQVDEILAGYDADPMHLPPRGMPGPSVKLALIVVGLAVGIVVLGLLALGLSSSPQSAAPSKVATAKGSPLKAVPGRPYLAPLISAGEPPDDIIDAVVLPSGSQSGSVINDTLAAEGYDEARMFTLDASEQDLITFFKVELPAWGWHVESSGLPHDQPGFEVLAQRAGSDGYYWEIGAVISPTTFPSSGPAKATGLTTYEIRLIQNDDEDD